VRCRHPLFLSVLSGLLFAFSWPETGGLTVLIFAAFVPLLVLEQLVSENPQRYRSRHLFFYTYIAFFVFNVITSWWIKNASLSGGVMAVVFNALFMAVVFQLFHVVKRKLNGSRAFLILSSFWMAFEYLHLRWDLTWPWLTLGNVFAGSTWMIQWYEYTGVFGGTLWIFAVNFLIYSYLRNGFFLKGRPVMKSFSAALLIAGSVLVPVLLSVLMNFPGLDFHKGGGTEVVVVQPNVDPYNEKFSGSYKEQLNTMLDLAETMIDSSTACVVFPETALTENLWENNLERTYSVQALHIFQQRHPGLDVVIGATSAYQYEPGEEHSVTARKFTDSDDYYDDFNTALFLSGSSCLLKYHKSKFVPGVERMPFPALFKPLEKLAINLGGTTGSLGSQDSRTVFVSRQNGLKAGPIICYESVFGEFVTGYVKNGANVLFIITNDGWWGDTPGYRQHLAYARLRAIETRRCIVRSANTGTSCFIDEWGNISQATAWWKPMAIKGRVYLRNELTFYVIHGDYIGRAAVIIALGFIGIVFILRIGRKKNPAESRNASSQS
jgi:apolipoprotein N-acyltransferase